MHCRNVHDDNSLLIALRDLNLAVHSQLHVGCVDRIFLRARANGAPERDVGLFLFALRPERTMHALGDQPMALVLFHARRARMQLDPFVVAACYDLTPAEAKVAVAVAQGQSAAHIAERHRVSIHTVRTQLKSAMGKTGTSRQTELVSLLASMPMAALDLRSN